MHHIILNLFDAQCLSIHTQYEFYMSLLFHVYSYGREYAAEPYLGHSIGPVAGYGVSFL